MEKQSSLEDTRQSYPIRRNRSRFSYGERVISLNKEDIENISKYLENPTKSGIWTLNINWINSGGISESIIKNLKNEFENKNTIEIRSGKLKINVKKEDCDKLIQSAQGLNFVFYIFTYLIHLERQDESFNQYLELSTNFKIIFELIDLEEIKKEYSDAFEYFKENIYFENFKPAIDPNKIVKIKDGLFVLPDYSSIEKLNDEKRREELRNIILLSLNPEPLEQLKILYEKINKIADASLLPVYSPEEEVFAPYFSFLEHAYKHFIYNDNITKLFKKSIEEYNEENYSHSISTIGLILEDYLIQIYETFFRDICPKGLTLGELYDLIENNIRKKYKSKPKPNPEIKPLYQSINKLIEKESTEPLSNTDVLKVMRDILTYINENNHVLYSKVESIQKKKETIIVFPKQVRENIYELIKNRNSISHKSRVPIGNYEALRTVYCCITLILWWINEKKCIDWKEVPDEILKKSIIRNSQL